MNTDYHKALKSIYGPPHGSRYPGGPALARVGRRIAAKLTMKPRAKREVLETSFRRELNEEAVSLDHAVATFIEDCEAQDLSELRVGNDKPKPKEKRKENE